MKFKMHENAIFFTIENALETKTIEIKNICAVKFWHEGKQNKNKEIDFGTSNKCGNKQVDKVIE